MAQEPLDCVEKRVRLRLHAADRVAVVRVRQQSAKEQFNAIQRSINIGQVQLERNAPRFRVLCEQRLVQLVTLLRRNSKVILAQHDQRRCLNLKKPRTKFMAVYIHVYRLGY